MLDSSGLVYADGRFIRRAGRPGSTAGRMPAATKPAIGAKDNWNWQKTFGRCSPESVRGSLRSELLGHEDASTTMIYRHVMGQGGCGMKSPLLDSL